MKNTLLVLVGLAIIGTCALYAAPAKPTEVEVWTGSDDGLTQRLRDAVESKFQSSSDFVPSRGKKPGTLIVTIPTHVEWTQNGERTHVRYKVEFSSSDGVAIGKSAVRVGTTILQRVQLRFTGAHKGRHASCTELLQSGDFTH